MTPIFPHRSDTRVAPSFFARFGCTMQAWIIGWAVTVYLSAAFQAFTVQSDIQAGTVFSVIFQTADNVPPLGKLTLGGLMALGLGVSAVFGREEGAQPYHRVGNDAAFLAVVAMIATLKLPVGYYPGTSAFSTAQILLHCLAAVFGGLTIQLANRACTLRKERRARS